MDEVMAKIMRKARRADRGAIKDGLGWLVESYDKVAASELRKICVEQMKGPNKYLQGEYFELYRLGLLVSAPHEFDSYMQYLEIDRKPEERFYLPRRAIMLRYVRSLQDLADGEINELFISMPPRVGKTTLAMFFLTWLIGRDPEHPNLYSSYSDTITKAFYNGVMEVLTDPDTYNFRQIFPSAQIVRTNAQDETIDIARKKRYASATMRSIYGTLNGACDAEGGIIMSDDLCSGIEEAMNKDRMVNLWEKVDNNLLPRGKSGTRYLWIGTRWSVIDPAGLRQDLLLNDDNFKDYKWRSINIPALNDYDESNFNYKYGVGFDTKYYRQRRASFERNNDMASWYAQYMGVPYEREGTVFGTDDLMYYNGVLPDKEPDRIFMAVDPAWGGGDFVAGPLIYQYGQELYVHDVIYDNGDKERTQPKVARMLRENNATALFVECTKTTAAYAEEIDSILRKEGRRINIQTKAAAGKKEDRIFAASPDIRNHMIFRESGKRSKEYELFMANVFSFKVLGKNKHDDAPDSLQMAINFAFPKDGAVVRVARRAF